MKTKGSLVHKADNTINPIIALALSVVNLLAPLREATLQEIPSEMEEVPPCKLLTLLTLIELFGDPIWGDWTSGIFIVFK